MSRSPREDKERDYKRSQSAARHGLRKQISRMKAKANRRYRRAESSALAQAGSLADDRIADRAEARIATTRLDRDPKWGPPPTLAQHVTDRLYERFSDMVDTFSAGPYVPERQRARTEQALTLICQERRAGDLSYVAVNLDTLLPDPVLPERRWRPDHVKDLRRREWFTAFLADAAEWQPRLVRWIADHAAH